MAETVVRTESVRIPRHRSSTGSCMKLAASIRDEGLRRPICLWRDGTLISGERRLFAHLLMEIPRIQAVFVGTVEEAAKHLLQDNEEGHLAVPQKWSEICRLWQTLRHLDEPAAVQRAEIARRRGVELRRLTQSGARPPGRSRSRSKDYVLEVVAEPFGISPTTAWRVESVFRTAAGLTDASDERRELAQEIMADFDNGGHISTGLNRLNGRTPAPARPERPRAVAPVEAAAARVQLAAWDRSLPQLEGLVAGLVGMGAPNAELTWEQVGPVHARLSAIRRELEKIIKQMKEINKS